MKNKTKPITRQAKEDSSIKVAMILPGAITDQSWNFVGYEGLITAKTILGVEVSYSESVQATDYEEIIRRYALSEYDLIIGHGSELGNASTIVAKDFPIQYFAVTNSDACGPNLAGLDTRNEEMGYVAGYIAGLLSKTETVAFIGATKIMAMVRAEQGFHLGVKKACPNCTVLTKYIGSFDNESMGRSTALSLIENGVDVIFNNDDAAGLGALKVAEEKKILAIGSDYDQKSVAPKAIITSILAYVTPMIVSIVQEVIEGKFIPDKVRMNGFSTGVYKLAPIDDQLVSKEQAENIQQVVEQIFAGNIYLPHLTSS